MRYLGLCACVMLLVGCDPPKDAAVQPPQVITSAAHPECGHDMDHGSSTAKGERTAPLGVSAAGFEHVAFTYNVPEFNDCQRLIVDSAGTLVYDSIAAIIADQRLDSLESDLGKPIRSAQIASSTVPVSTIRAATAAIIFAEGDYPTLGIKRGSNCLYVWRKPMAGTSPPSFEWLARMVPANQSEKCADRSIDDLPPTKDLKVSRKEVKGFPNDTDYPPVARWDWDGVHKQQYIGVKCGAAWCEIHDVGFTSSDSLSVSSGTPLAVRRVRLIKGWYDQQLLATMGPTGKLVPSQVMGTIVPDVDLGRRVKADFKGRHIHVADISLAGPADDPAFDKYATKFNFLRTDVDHPIPLTISDTTAPTSDHLWVGELIRTTPGGDRRLSKNIMRRAVSLDFANNSRYRVPGIARWRWMKTDEGSWARCAEGCCELSDY